MMSLRVRHLLTGFRSFSRTHGHIPKGALERSSKTNLREMSRVSTSLPTNFHAFSIPFRMASKSSSLLIQISSLRRNNNVFTLIIYSTFLLMSRYTNKRVLSRLTTSTMTGLFGECSCTHQTRKPFYITSRHQKNPASRENYASE